MLTVIWRLNSYFTLEQTLLRYTKMGKVLSILICSNVAAKKKVFTGHVQDTLIIIIMSQTISSSEITLNLHFTIIIMSQTSSSSVFVIYFMDVKWGPLLHKPTEIDHFTEYPQIVNCHNQILKHVKHSLNFCNLSSTKRKLSMIQVLPMIDVVLSPCITRVE